MIRESKVCQVKGTKPIPAKYITCTAAYGFQKGRTTPCPYLQDLIKIGHKPYMNYWIKSPLPGSIRGPLA